jgi:hypothetical protein
MVENVTQNPKIEGSNPDTGKWREEIKKSIE